MKKKYRHLFMASTMSIALLITGCSQKDASTDETVKETPVQVETITKGSLSVTNEIIARVVSESTANILPKTMGELVEVRVEKGDYVEKGDILAVIDSSNQQLSIQMEEISGKSAQSQYEQALISKEQAEKAVENAKSAVKQAEINVQKIKDGQTTGTSGLNAQQAQLDLTNAENNYEQMLELLNNGEISQEDFDQVENVLKQAQGIVQQVSLQNSAETIQTQLAQSQQALAQAKVGLSNAEKQLELAKIGVKQAQVGIDSNQMRVENAKDQLDNFNIVATASGEVTTLNGKVGEMVSTSAPFAIVVDLESIKVEAKLTADQLVLFEKGQEIQVEVPSLGKRVPATVQYVSKTPDNTGFYVLEASLDNHGGDIKPGMISKVLHKSDVIQESLIVPTDAVIEKGNEMYVFVVKDGVAVKTSVKVIQSQSELTAIEGEGITENMTIVTKGQNTLSDGLKVNIIEEE